MAEKQGQKSGCLKDPSGTEDMNTQTQSACFTDPMSAPAGTPGPPSAGTDMYLYDRAKGSETNSKCGASRDTPGDHDPLRPARENGSTFGAASDLLFTVDNTIHRKNFHELYYQRLTVEDRSNTPSGGDAVAARPPTKGPSEPPTVQAGTTGTQKNKGPKQ